MRASIASLMVKGLLSVAAEARSLEQGEES